MSALDEFRERLRQIKDLNSVHQLLEWDQETTMPARGAEARARHAALVRRFHHEAVVDPRLAELADQLEQQGELPIEDAAQLRLFRQQQRRARDVPAALVAELAAAESRGFPAWQEARRRADFTLFLPHLERIIELKLEEAQAMGYTEEPYDAHLDLFEPGLTTAAAEPMLEGVARELRPLLDAVLAAERGEPKAPPGPYDTQRQRAFSEKLAARLGFDYGRGRFDLAPHPFIVGLDPGDVRLTSRFLERSPVEGILATVHETGHSLYEQGMPDEWSGTLLADSPSYGVHESQSRLWENHVGRTLEFWEGEIGRLREELPELGNSGPDALHREATTVQRSLIRVEADELTYPLHIILRFQLELGLFRGDLRAADLPGAFNERMRALLGLTPANDAEGVLQDVHWSHGSFGYFPSYLIGSIYAAAIFERAQADLGGPRMLQDLIRAADHRPLREWLREKIHRRGALLPARELMHQVAGLPADGAIDASAYVRHLRERYGALYSVAA